MITVKINKKELRMSLLDIAIGKNVLIKSIDADSNLKRRLRAFGIGRNSQIKVLGESIGKQTIKISIGATEVALRKNEAEKIIVEEIKE
jgi:Fe2+ transport system protein FeoA